MKIAKFTYQDLKGKITERKVLVVNEPTDKISGIDLSELEPDEQQEFAEAYAAIMAAAKSELQALQAAWDLKYNYRQFFADKITNLEY